MGVFVLPLVELKPALYQEGSALPHVLSNHFGLPTESVDIYKRHFFFGFAGIVFPAAVDGHANASNGCSLRSIAQLRVPGKITREHDTIKVSHRRILSEGRF